MIFCFLLELWRQCRGCLITRLVKKNVLTFKFSDSKRTTQQGYYIYSLEITCVKTSARSLCLKWIKSSVFFAYRWCRSKYIRERSPRAGRRGMSRVLVPCAASCRGATTPCSVKKQHWSAGNLDFPGDARRFLETSVCPAEHHWARDEGKVESWDIFVTKLHREVYFFSAFLKTIIF